jgi:pseudaminic acid synthase
VGLKNLTTTHNADTEEMTVKIAERSIGAAHPPFIIAELSANHGGDFKRALRIISATAEAGADAVKFQAYTPDSLTLDLDQPDFQVAGDNLWTGRKLHDLYAEAATPYEWFPDLFAACRDQGLIPFASAFDRTAIDMLERLDCPAYKIASFEAVDLALISACAETGKPLIISIGLCNEEEISDALKTARSAGAKDIILLQCNSVYPAKDDEANLITIPALMGKYGVLVGYSDHTLGTVSSVAACALGACVIEKHVIDSPKPETADSAFSLPPDKLKTLVADCHTAWHARGQIRHGPTPSELDSLAFRRSLYVTEDMNAGDAFTGQTVRSIRPGHGLAPKHLANILGCRSTRTIAKGEALEWSMILKTGDR